MVEIRINQIAEHRVVLKTAGCALQIKCPVGITVSRVTTINEVHCRPFLACKELSSSLSQCSSMPLGQASALYIYPANNHTWWSSHSTHLFMRTYFVAQIVRRILQNLMYEEILAEFATLYSLDMIHTTTVRFVANRFHRTHKSVACV